jgi:hypothetical protein
MAIASDLVAHRRAQHCVVLDQQDAHGSPLFPASSVIAPASDDWLTRIPLWVQLAVRFPCQHNLAAPMGRSFADAQ